MMRNKTLLLVDDEPISLAAVEECLRRDYRTRIATDGRSALELARRDGLPDLILLDVSMPGMDGYEVCARLKREPATAEIPVIFLSACDRSEDVARGLELGAVDFVSKPVIPPILAARVRNHLRLRESSERLADRNRNLGRLVRERTRALQQQTDEVLRIQELTTVALGALAETRDHDTGNHIVRTQAYVRSLAEELARGAYFARHRIDYHWSQIWKCAPLHDIGKVGIPDGILLKPGRLSTEEFAVMKQHTLLGRTALLNAEARAGARQQHLRVAGDIAYCHHERWDGAGYPEGIAGGSIPVAARLMAVADVYDALISKRVYKAAVSHEDALAAIRAGRGGQFDPDVVDCALALADRFHEIAWRFGDSCG